MINMDYYVVEQKNFEVKETGYVAEEQYLPTSDRWDIAALYGENSTSSVLKVTKMKTGQVEARALSKATIKDVQTKLNNIGYSCGTPDGIAGKNTNSAVMSFQKLCGLKDQSGQITNETISRLDSVYSRKQKGILSRGLRGNASVKKLQQDLNTLKYNCGTPDGIFGSGTETAVKNFQSAKGLTVDGIAGSNTLSAISTALQGGQKPDPGTGYNIITSEGIAFTKSHEGCSLKPYNNGQTIGYGMDIANYPDVKINYQSDGSITQAEADRLFEIVYRRKADTLNTYLNSKNYKLDKYTYAAALDLAYNRHVNELTKEVFDAMAANNSQKVKTLFSDFDYRYAKRYIYQNYANPDKEAKDYVTRNPGLKTRRTEEYTMFTEKRFLA